MEFSNMESPSVLPDVAEYSAKDKHSTCNTRWRENHDEEIYKSSNHNTCQCDGSIQKGRRRCSTPRLKTDHPNHAQSFKCSQPKSYKPWCFHKDLTLRNVILTLMLYLSATGVSAQSWVDKPEDTSVHLSSTAVINCEVENLDERIVEWRQYRDDGTDSTFFVNGNRVEAPTRFNVLDNGRGFTLNVTGATTDDDADYRCSIQNWDNEKVKLTVLVEPSPPNITTNSSDVYEGDFLELRCQSTNGNPAPTFRWYRDDIEVTTATTIPPATKYGMAASVLVRRMATNDHMTVYRCEVENEANQGSPRITTIALDVKYAPVIDLGLYDPFKVILGKPTTLTCTVDSNPQISSENNIQWYKDDVWIGDGQTWSVPAIEKTDAGLYRCDAFNTIGPGTGEVTLDVLYGPDISLYFSNGQTVDTTGVSTVTTVHQVHEGLALNVTCVVDSNPPVQMYNIRFLQAGLVIKQGPEWYTEVTSREDSGNYSCDATVVMPPSGDEIVTEKTLEDFTLRVLYIPGEASITVPQTVIKGDPATLTCTVDDPGDPVSYFQWSRLGQSEIVKNNSASLSFVAVGMSDHGDYVCTPRNEVGVGTQDIKLLDVMERPEWLGPTLPPSVTVQVNLSVALEVRCQLRGRPAPSVRWYKDGVQIEASNEYKIAVTQERIDEHSWNVTSVLRWDGPDRHPSDTSLSHTDAGNYSCRADNEYGEITGRMVLLVQYPPIIEALSEKVAIDRNSSATMSCQSHSYPFTTYEWYNATNKIVPGGRVFISMDTVDGEFPYLSTLTILNVSTVDLGDYRCRGCNIMGCGDAAIHLTVKDVPDRPASLAHLSQTWQSVFLSWAPGFDGGYPQMFIVYYRYYDNKTQTYLEGERDAGDTDRFNVTDLYPSVRYTFTVYSRNSLGPSDPSNSIAVTADGLLIPPPGRVSYDQKSRVLSFTSPSSNYCAQIEVNGGSAWDVYEDCAPTEGSIQIQEGRKVADVRVALCLIERKDVCSSYEYAEFVGEDLPKETIIIVGCVCGGVVVILTIILIVLCCKRNQAKQHYEKQQETRQMTPVPPPVTLSAPPPATKAPPSGMDNPGLDQTDGHMAPPPRVFTTDTSGNQYSTRPASPYNYDHAPNGYPNGHPNGHLGGHHGNKPAGLAPPPSYDNLRNEALNQHNQHHLRNEALNQHNQLNHNRAASPLHNKMLYLDDPYDHKEPSSRSESGVSTPDPQKPKKVIYEVVV